MKTNILTILSILILATSCAPGMPGYISETVSEFDGTKEIKMEPAWIYGVELKLGLFKNSKMKPNEVILTAVVKGAYNIDEGKSLQFNVDGKIYKFASIDSLTNIDTTSGFYGNGVYLPASNWSSKDYIVTKSFIKELIEAQRAIVKIELDKEYIEGNFSSDAPTTARPPFSKFYKKLESL